ncbi:VCBS repeat-containing protein [Aquimarina sp. AU474]|uniref:VCBS repeat-containing protein n=1 Tax=Aquimarina sp. AU474 TaxID=2108529 RepID=UPI000D690FA0|nr:VCBS repeat-containing protein [Aquimarina sp. AU474]
MNNIFKVLFVLALVACSKEETQSDSYLFSKLNPESTGINFKNLIQEDKEYNIVNYLYYYNGGGVAVGDINNDELPDIYFVSNRGENKLYLNQGNLKFKDITNTSKTGGNSDWNTGVTMVDINNDGYLDIYVCAVINILGFEGHNELFINNGDGTFSEESAKYGLDYRGYATQAYFFDYDKDDDLDVYLVNHALHTKTSHGPSYIRKKRTNFVGDVLLKNENSKYTDVSLEAKIHGGANGYGLSASIADFNNDGWDDIYVCNDFHEDDYYYINNQDGTFKEQLSKSFAYTSRFSMGSDAADINGDGYQDLITLDMLPYSEKVLKESDGDVSYKTQDFLISQGYQKQYARNMFQVNNRGEYFTETGLFNNIAATDWSWAPLIADYNMDGNQDVFITNGIYKRPNNLDFMRYMSNSFKNKSQNKTKDDWLINSLGVMPSGKVPNHIFEGNSKTFTNKTGDWIEDSPTLSNGATYADLDLDGDLDLIINNLNDYSSIFENKSNISTNNSNLSVKLNYKKSNVHGIGSKVHVYSDGKIQSKQLFTSRGFISATEPILHFGIGQIKVIDSIKVIWPDNFAQTIVPKNEIKKVHVNYDSTKTKAFRYNLPKKQLLFEEKNLITYKHHEDSYNDFDVDKLIPYKVSTQGPAIAIGDVNNDGKEDIFIGGASLQKSKLFLSHNHTFKEKHIPAFKNDSISEDVDATFLDIDNDNDLDLFVASGIISNINKEYQNDRLYINDGKGNFKKLKNAIPNNKNNTAIIKPYDYDQDGDIDLFIGNRSDSITFGRRVNSYVLNNDGSGKFEKDDNFLLQSMVTDAIWSDINNDNIKDLLIATEWDKPRIFINNRGILKESLIKPNIKGLWQSITYYDIDYDGDKDIVLGNWGLNTKFKASPTSPLVLHYADFDNNNKKETILTYTLDGNYFPVHSKDELSSQVNIINKRYQSYNSYANQSIDDILKILDSKNIIKYEVHTLASGYLENINGTYNTFRLFPDALQLSPITCFLKYDFLTQEYDQLLLGGNFHGLNTYHGVFSSNDGFMVKKDSLYNAPSYIKTFNQGLSIQMKELRSIKTLKHNTSTFLIAVSNNDSIVSYQINETKPE